MDNVFASTHPLIAAKLTLLRDVSTEPKKFRELVREISAMLTYEATVDLAVRSVTVQTPMMETTGVKLLERIGLVPICGQGLEWWKGSGV